MDDELETLPAGKSGSRGGGDHGGEESPITVYPAWCKKCGICVAFCPKGVLEAGPEGVPVAVRPESCTRCRMCELRCPDFAISVAAKEGEAGSGGSLPGGPRRDDAP